MNLLIEKLVELGIVEIPLSCFFTSRLFKDEIRLFLITQGGWYDAQILFLHLVLARGKGTYILFVWLKWG